MESTSSTDTAPSAAAPGRGAGALVGVAAFLTTLYAPLWSLAEIRLEAPFRYFAADAFYYLAIAKNSLGQGIYTYDGRTPTNGFNPLWEYYLWAGFAVLPPEQGHQLTFAFLSSAFFVATGIGFLAAAMFALVPRPALVLLTAVPGFYYVAFSTLDPHFGSTWSFVNGMESGLSILFFGLLCYVVYAQRLLATITPARAAIASALVTAVTLSRLDDIFLFVPLFVVFAVRSPTRAQLVRSGVIAALIPFLTIGAYLLYNYSYSGMLLPISGVAKSYGLLNPGAWQNTLRESVATVVPSRGGASPWAWSGAAWRAIQLLAPLACCWVWLFRRFRGGAWRERLASMDLPHQWATVLAAFYVTGKVAYNLVYVHLWDQGHWYFPLTIMTANLVVLLQLDEIVARRQLHAARVHASMRRWAIFGAVACYVVVVWGNGFISLKQYSTYGADFFNFWQRREAIGAELDQLAPSTGILEYDDGIVAYTLNRPAISGTALAGDREVLDRSRRGEALQLARDRGAHLIASVWYMQEWTDAAVTGPPDNESLRAAVQTLAWGQNIEGWTFTVLLHRRAPESHFAVVRFEPAASRSDDPR